MKYIYIFLISLLLFSKTLYSQTQKNFESISIEEGLTHGEVHTILCDSYGYIWIGTKNGLNKYDGYKITTYQAQTNNPHSISYNTIRCLYEDSNGDIWIGTSGNGLNRYNRETDSFEQFLHNPNDKNSLSSHNVYAIYEDSKHNLWVGTYGGGLQLLDRKTKKFKTYTANSKNKNSLAGNSIRAISEDSQGNLWIGCDGDGLSKFNYSKNTFKNYVYDQNKNSICANAILCIYIESDTSIYIGTWAKGISIFNSKTEKFQTITHTSNINSLNSNEVFSIYKDLNGLFWFTTRNGIDVYNQKNKTFKHNIHNDLDQSSISADFTTYVTSDKSGNIWIATAGGGVCKTNIIGYYFEQIKKNNLNLQSQDIQCFYKRIDNTLFIGTTKGIQIFNPKNYTLKDFPLNNSIIPKEFITKVIFENKDYIWIGTDGMGLIQYDKKNKNSKLYTKSNNKINSISNNSIISLLYDSLNNALWIGTFGGGLNKLNLKNFTFENYTINKKIEMENVVYDLLQINKDTLLISTINNGLLLLNINKKVITPFCVKKLDYINNTEIIDLYRSNEGVIWLGTSSGLIKLDKQTKKPISYISKNLGIICNSIIEDKKGNLWISTNKGIIKFNTNTNQIENHFIENGIQGLLFNQRAGCILNGEIYFGGTKGITKFNPLNQKPNTIISKIIISDFKSINSNQISLINPLFFSKIFKNKEIYLPYTKNSFSIEFAYLHFESSKSNKYKYKLEGFDNEWHFVTSNNRRITYTNLSGGVYYFKILACNSDGIWTPNATIIKITIETPFWDTIIFKLLLCFFIIGMISVYIIHKEKKHLLKQKNLEEKIDANELIKKQNENLEQLYTLLLIKNEEIITQDESLKIINDEILEKNVIITESIKYAQHIQSALLFNEFIFNDFCNDYFLIYKPKDIVSGDFYWHTEITTGAEKSHIFASIDCTGHGVSGAFITIVTNFLLDKIIRYKFIYNPSDILNELHNQIIKLFSEEYDIGMDITISRIYNDSKKIVIASAMQKFALYTAKNGFTIYKGNNFSIGDKLLYSKTNLFEQLEFEYETNDILYLFSDGFSDQFGGEKNTKYMEGNFLKLLDSIKEFEINEQKNKLIHTFNIWKKNEKQIDDVLIIGLKLK